MTQIPPPGTKVRRGWWVRVAQSLGPLRVAIPNVTGGSERVAELNVQRRGLSLGSVAHISLPDVAIDRVISQSPSANASGVSAPKINLLVNDGTGSPEYLMPNLTGQPLGSAMLALQDAGIKVGKVSVVPLFPPSPGAPQTASGALSAVTEPSAASMIVTQTPTPGQKIVAGSAVNFEVR